MSGFIIFMLLLAVLVALQCDCVSTRVLRPGNNNVFNVLYDQLVNQPQSQ